MPFSARLGALAFLLVAASCFLLSDSHGQMLPRYPEVRVVRLDYSNSGGEQGHTRFRYDRFGQLEGATWQLNDGSRYSVNYHLLDFAGREVEKSRLFSDGLTSTETYTYDADGRRATEVFTRSDGVSGQATFLWNAQGQLIETRCDNFKGWLSGTISYTYRGEHLVEGTITQGDKVIGTIAYERDEAGHLQREFWDFGGRWNQTFSYTYEQTPGVLFAAASPLTVADPVFRIAWENYDFSGKIGGPSSYVYGPEGQLTEKVFTRSDGLTTTTGYTFDARGNLVSSHRAYHDGQSAEFQYTFDGRGHLTGKSFERSDGARGREVYTYDRLGRLTGAEFDNMDFWLTGTLSFQRDDRGNLTTGHFEGRDGMRAELDFATDSWGNVTRIHWDLGGGQTQTYTYHYEKAPTHRDGEPGR
jgi:YD repeat-containing protein